MPRALSPLYGSRAEVGAEVERAVGGRGADCGAPARGLIQGKVVKTSPVLQVSGAASGGLELSAEAAFERAHGAG